jgi:choline kinase
MKAVILAAGVSSRLTELARDIPKCLLKIGKTTVVDYQIELLTSVGKLEFRDVYVVGGYRIEKLNYLKDFGVHTIFNPKFREFNNIYSFYLANNFVDEDFILLNGDAIVHQEILKCLVDSKYGTAFVTDNVKKLGEEEMKVLVNDKKIVKFGKEIDPKIANGEYIGLAKFSVEDSEIVFDCMKKLLKKGKTDIWYENAINYVLDKINAFTVHTNGLPWIEIDTPKDYEKAIAEVYPQISASECKTKIR